MNATFSLFRVTGESCLEWAASNQARTIIPMGGYPADVYTLVIAAEGARPILRKILTQ